MATVTLADCPVDHEILYKPGAKLNSDEGSWSASLGFGVAYEDMAAFCAFAGGTPQTVVLTGGSVTRLIPLSHPDFPSLLCRSIQAEGVGWAGGDHTRARVVCGFGSVPYPTDGSAPFLTKNLRAGAEVYTIAGTKYRFSDGTPVQADAGIVVPTLIYAITLYQCPTLDDDLVASLIGKINATTFLGRAAGTMRLDAVETQDTRTAAAQTAYTKTIQAAFRPTEWNKFLKPDGQWDTPLKPDSTPAYSSGELNDLLI